MRMKNLLLLLSLLGIGTGCSSDDALDDGTPETGSAPTIQLMFNGSGEGVDYTKAIATEPETRMDDLKVYIFASNEKDGTYYYVQTFTKTDAPTDGSSGTFNLQAAGAGQLAVIKPDEIEGLPYLKLYCVANTELFAQDGVNTLNLTAVTAYNSTSHAPTPGLPTTDQEFEAAYTASINDATPKAIVCPLPMSGTAKTKISGSLAKVNIEMTRPVARFDVYNDRLTSRLTITSLGVRNGRKNAPLFSTTPLPEITADQRTAELITYGDVDFTQWPTANRGDTESALYVCPGAVSDNTLLIITGTFQNPNGQEIDVTYPVPVKIEDVPTAIGRNNRYRLRIGNVTELQVSAYFEIADWTSGGGVITTPEHTRPVFEGENGTDLSASVKAAQGETAPLPEVSTDPYVLRMQADKGSFMLTAYANSSVDAEVEVLTRAYTPWLTQTDVTTEDDPDHADRKLTTFTFAYDHATGQLPCQLILRNAAASYDPDLWTVITVKAPFAAPTLAEAAGGNSPGNTLTINDTNSATASMLPTIGSTVKVNVTATDEVTVDAPQWLSATPVRGSEEGATVTYNVKITADPAGVTNGTVTFKNAEKASLTSTLTVNLQTPANPATGGTN